MSFEELDREVRQDLMAERWRKYRPGIIALVLSVLAAVGGYKGYQYYQQQQEITAADLYYNATQVLLQDRDAGIVALEGVIQNNNALGYRALAQLKLAAEYVHNDEPEPARTLLLGLADDTQTPKFFVASATIQAAMIPADPETNTDLLRRLTPLLHDDSPWRHAARVAAVELALINGDKAKALEILQLSLEDSGTPQTARVRINKLQTLLS